MTSLPLMYSTAILDQFNLFHSDTTAKKRKPWCLLYYSNDRSFVDKTMKWEDQEDQVKKLEIELNP